MIYFSNKDPKHQNDIPKKIHGFSLYWRGENPHHPPPLFNRHIVKFNTAAKATHSA
jgi:hypothetical protein